MQLDRYLHVGQLLFVKESDGKHINYCIVAANHGCVLGYHYACVTVSTMLENNIGHICNNVPGD